MRPEMPEALQRQACGGAHILLGYQSVWVLMATNGSFLRKKGDVSLNK